MSYGLSLVTAPAQEPLTTAECVHQTGAPDGVHDQHFLDSIAAARRYVETRLNRQLITATWDLKLDRFPCAYDRWFIPKAPLASVTSITYSDASGVTQTLATSVYKVITSREPGEIALKYGQAWPVVYAEPEVVTVRFVAGYGATQSAFRLHYATASIRRAMLLLITHWFENRSAVLIGSISKELELSLDSLLTGAGYGDEFLCFGPESYASSY